MLLCYPSIATFANASSSLHLSIYNSRPSLVASFVVPPVARGSLFHRHPSMSIQRETSQQKRQKPSLDTTWSNAVREKSELNESRFGVRKRVRSVLDKAKKRTGIENSSTSTVKRDTEPKRINGDASYYQTGPNVVAEAASLGGLGAVVVDDEGTVDAALDYIGNKGGQTGNLYNDTSSGGSTSIKSGETYEDPAILTKVGNEVSGASTKNGVKVSSPTSSVTPNIPSMAPNSFQRPEDDFILKSKDTEKVINDTSTRKPYVEKDAFTGDVSAAFSLPREPLPFELPSLDREQTRRLIAGERVQFQDDMGRAGSGYVVWDVKAPASVVWDCLLDFQSYPQTITTVREVVMYTNTHLKEDYRAEKPLDFEDGTAAICKHGVPSVTRAQFSLSKFRLKIAAVHKYRPHPKGDYMIFTLDKASSNPVLKYAKGIWYTESNPDGKEGYTRVWLLCELRVSRLLPQWIVDYAAARAMPRATTWLKPQTEAAAMLWLKDSAERDSRRN
eukprot:CAMPEP_0183708524 /NCGR_PEP_ID=MMETSP0737-20130205/4819_1 /TAXON_ID=385413 /ORGANISM="Thalassiosira miniscula, Strain CCMP1093" /LENGTH=501 /DNA_ID=CAMNT_0025936417 /DNA_START=457 /DNA_END=1962 /DNA_ORIENTATION=+